MTESLETLFTRGLEAHRKGNLFDAEAAYRGVLATNPKNFDALHLLGVVHAQRGQATEAEVLIGAALAVDDSDARAHNNYGLALLDLRRPADALVHFDKAAALEPGLAWAHSNRGSALRALGRLDEALTATDQAIALNASYAEAIANRAAILQTLGRLSESLTAIDQAVALAPNLPNVHFNRATLLETIGRPRDALAAFERAIQLKPDYIQALCGRGFTLLSLGRLDDALAGFERALIAAPQSVNAEIGKGTALQLMQRPDAALSAFERALRLNAQSARALTGKGNTLRLLKRYDEALACFENASALDPDDADALCSRAQTLKQIGRTEEALTLLDAAVVAPNHNPHVHHNRGLILQSLGFFEDAVRAHGVATALKPDFAQAFSDRAAALLDLERWTEAAASAGQSTALDPNNADAHYNHGTALQHLRRFDDALADFDTALRLKPEHAAALNNRGLVLQDMNRPGEALASFDAALRLNPQYSETVGAAFSVMGGICDWQDYNQRREALLQRARGGESIMPFVLLAASDDPRLQRQVAERYAQRLPPQDPALFKAGTKHDRLRVAYVTADFFDHATAQLMAETFEHHDRAKFEFYAIVLNGNDNGAMRKRLNAAFEHVIETNNLTDFGVAQRMAELEIDIAVDLKGYTKDCRPRIFSFRPAPISAAYIGYPGTSGSSNIDYLIADSFVVPPETHSDYSEKIVSLGGCYQANDSTKRIGVTPSRASLGLPEKGFVFCSFNGCYKITPEIFDIWARLLRAVPESVLWLYADGELAKTNLRREAQTRGIAPERVVFAAFAKLEDHLARLKCADLFLDTFPVCAHTTASDSLWAGLPLLTCSGASFVSRVAGSLLTTMGVPELITANLRDYETQALRLARDPTALTELRDKIAKARETTSLFNGAATARKLERAYQTMWEAHTLGVKPQSFKVAE